MSVDSSSKVQDGFSLESPDEDGSLLGYDSDSACVGGVMQLPNMFKNQTMWSAAKLSRSQHCVTLLVGNAAGHCTDPAADVEKGCSNAWAEDQLLRSAKSQGLVTHVRKALQRQIRIHLGGKLVQHLLDYFLMLLKIAPKEKLTAERGQDAANNRWMKYKRFASFDSRKVVLFFSILSSMGTLILIYLTLRVRQIAEASVPI